MTRGWIKLEAATDKSSTILREQVLDLNEIADALDEAEAEARRKAAEPRK